MLEAVKKLAELFGDPDDINPSEIKIFCDLDAQYHEATWVPYSDIYVKLHEPYVDVESATITGVSYFSKDQDDKSIDDTELMDKLGKSCIEDLEEALAFYFSDNTDEIEQDVGYDEP